MKIFDVTLQKPKIFDVTLRKLIISADITVKSIPLRLYAYVRNKFTLVHKAAIIAKKMVRVSHKTVLKEEAVKTTRIIFDKAKNNIALVSAQNVGVSITKNIIDIWHKLFLKSYDVEPTWVKFTGKGQNKINLIQHSVIGVMYTVFKVREKMAIKTPNINPFIVKFESAKNNKTGLRQQAVAWLGKPIELTSVSMALSSKVSTTLVKRRTLGELDGDGVTQFTLAEFDDIKLEDIDYITI